MERGYQYRIYPTEEQEHWLIRNIGCCRFVYNRALAMRKDAYEKDGTSLSYYDTARDLTAAKAEYPWLKEADSASLQQSLRHLDTAYRNFFRDTKRTGYPKFKSRRRSRLSYTTPMNGNSVRVTDGHIRLPKAGNLRAVLHRKAPEGWKILSATVSMERDGTWYCSVLYQYEDTVSAVSHPEEHAVGLDYKSDGLYVSSDRETCGSPKYFRKAQKRLAKLQKDLSRKQGSRKGETESANHRKQRLKVAKCYRHIANQRKDFLHKESTAIAKQYDLVCVENLNMKALSNKGFGNGKATMDNGYGMFLTLLEYKLRNRGGMLVRIDKWFPSSQLCSCCGTLHPEVKDLRIRHWTCSDCGAEHDRDINAAVNIRNEGIRQYLADIV